MSMGFLRIVAEVFAPVFQENMSWLLTGENVQGLHLSFDRYWYGIAFGEIESHVYRRPHLWQLLNNEYSVSRDPGRLKEFLAGLVQSFFPGGPLSWWEKEWDLRCRSMGYPPNSLPIIFRVILRQDQRKLSLKELPRAFEGFPIAYETRPPAIGLSALAVLAASDNVGRTSPSVDGTAGGFLLDANNGIAYLLSCAHVLGNVGTPVVAGSTSVNVGRVVRSVMPPTNPPNSSCSSRAFLAPHNLDIALAAIDGSITPEPSVPGIGKPTYIRTVPSMKEGDQVDLVGQTSRRVPAELDSLTIYHEIQIGGQPHCFGNCFSLCPPKPWYVNTRLVKPGDSGSWILHQAKSMIGWDGILIAGDGAHAYACFAEDAFNDITRNVSSTLTLFP